MTSDIPPTQVEYCAELQDVFQQLALCDGQTSEQCSYFGALVDFCADVEPAPNSVASWPVAASVIIVIILIVFSGIFSGLNLGLLGLDLAGLRIVERGGNPKLKKCARKIMTVRKHGNWLLCSLLLGNVAVNAGLAIFLDNLFTGITGFISSTALIVVFGEIVPQALCTRYALQIGARTIWLVWIVMVLICPVAWPISKVLDWALGDEVGTIYNNDELKELISFHINAGDAELEEEVGTMMRGALNFPKAEVREVMTPWKEVFKLSSSAKLDFTTLTHIFKSGHSRIPLVDEKDKVVGLLFVKDLVLIQPHDETPVMTIVENFGSYGRDGMHVPHIFSNVLLAEVMRNFREGGSHLAIVQDVNNQGPGDPFYYNIGIVTLEDIVEFILQMEIFDETDKRGSGRRSFDVGKLSLFDYRRILPPEVTPQEAQAIFIYLSSSCDIFKPESHNIAPKNLKKLISSSKIIQVIVDDSDGTGDKRPFARIQEEEVEEKYEKSDVGDQSDRMKDISLGGILLYQRGVPSEFFTLILDGKIEVEAGREKFVSKLARWTVLCEDCLESVLTNPDESFVPDFTAKVTENARVFRISRKRFRAATFKGAEGEGDGYVVGGDELNAIGEIPVFQEDANSNISIHIESEMAGRNGRRENIAILPAVVPHDNEVEI